MGLVLPLTITVKGKGERFVWFQISLLLLRISAMLLTFPDMLNEKKKKSLRFSNVSSHRKLRARRRSRALISQAGREPSHVCVCLLVNRFFPVPT